MRGFLCNLTILFLSLSLLTACKKNRFEIDVKDVSGVKVTIERFDRDFHSMDTLQMQQSIEQMRQRYGRFFDLFVNSQIPGAMDTTLSMEKRLCGFLNDSIYRNNIYPECQLVFADVADIENELDTAFRYIHHYFPEKKIPRVAMHVSGFGNSVMVTPDMISASIDCYLGEDYAPYSQIVFDYQRKRMNRANVALDLLYAYLSTEFEEGEQKNLLQCMLNRGRILYLMSVCLPGHTDAEIMGYDERQYQWCIDNEKQMWNYLIEQKRLYNTSHLVITKFVEPAPFTSEFPQDSPGQAVLWMGLKIVRQYMENNSTVSLDDLMKESSAQKILEGSRYKP
ncbi:MAG: hypothetical protein J6Y79_02655 [Paludibacteraceae bacterium]|nr:hypothetical protein [Paludibacteraceae bacterium]